LTNLFPFADLSRDLFTFELEFDWWGGGGGGGGGGIVMLVRNGGV